MEAVAFSSFFTADLQDVFQTGPKLVRKCKPGFANLGEENLRSSCVTVGKGLFSIIRAKTLG